MVGQKVPSGSAAQIAEILDSTEIAELISELEALRWTGRKGYPIRALVGACLAKSLYAIPTWSRTAALIAEHAALRDALGAAPSVYALYRFSTKLRQHKPLLDACLSRVADSLHERLPDMGRDVAIDASDTPAYGNGQRTLSRNGPERQKYSDPDASWGHRSAISVRKGGGFYGFRVHAAVCAVTGLPLVWEVRTARDNETTAVPGLLDALHVRGFKPETIAMDRAYDNGVMHDACADHGAVAIFPLRQTPAVKRGEHQAPECEHGRWTFAGADFKRKLTKWRCPTGECQPKSIWRKASRLHPLIPRETKRWRDLYRGRALLGEGATMLSDGDPERAATLLREALALWRGPALADLAYESFVQVEVARLEERRLEALETRIEADLALGRHGELVAELGALVDEQPLREQLRRQLMLALYRTGRQPDALQTYRDARDALVEELGLEPSAELRDLHNAMLHQDPALTVEPPELRARRHLPTPATPLVGRRAELEYVHELFGKEDARLATLTGPGGTGKTRLALQAAWELAERFPDGVYFVGLAPVRDSELVPAAIAHALNVREAPGRPLADALKENVRNRQLLLVHDNFEHVHEAATFVSELLAEASGLRALVTSRTRLRLYGEHEYPVPPLTEEEALDLFVARARAVRPGFALDGARTHVAELCRRLDGLPLAIELAAARSSEFSPEQMLGFLTQQLELATHGPVDVPVRQQTLRATIEWSHGLLDEAERNLFARLSVFLGGCTLEAAEDVCGVALETLASLVDKSLVRETVDPDGDPRFVMLETIREYALEQLEESGEAEAVRLLHAEHFLALAEEAEPHLRGRPGEWLERLELEHDNLRAALDGLEESRESEVALRMTAAVWRFWYLRGYLTEGRRRLEHALRADGRPTAARAKALNGAAVVALNTGDAATAKVRAEEGLALHHALGDVWGAAYSRFMLGHVAVDLPTAQHLYEECVRVFRELGDEHSALLATRNLAWTYEELGDLERARALHEDNLRRARETSNERMEASTLGALADYAREEGRMEEAGSMLRESLRIHRDVGDLLDTAVDLCRFAAVLADDGRAETATRLLSSFGALGDRIGDRRSLLAEMNAETFATIRTQLDEAAFAEACEQGQALTLDDAVALALDS